jgi:sec-independent protein translocase protein TatA
VIYRLTGKPPNWAPVQRPKIGSVFLAETSMDMNMTELAIGFGVWEISVIAALGLLIFGAKRIPELSRSLGKSVVEFKKGLKDTPEEDTEPEKSES